MGHLGEGTEITTVQDKEIVLTASNGQHFKMKIADLAEAVRQVMPVATSERTGLFSSQLLIGNIGDVKVINFDTYNGEVPSIVTKGNSGGTSPTTNSGDWFVLCQFSNGTNYKVQIAIGFSTNGLYIRNSADMRWGAWRVY